MASNLSKPKVKVSKPSETSENPPKPAETLIGPAADFRAEIEKSKAMISDADIPQKNKGGRPSKEQQALKEAADREAAAAQLTNILPPESLKTIVALPYTLAAAHTGFEGFYLQEEEAGAIVPPLIDVLKTYAPQVKGEHVALTSLALAVISVSLGKYMAFAMYKRQQAFQPPAKDTPKAELKPIDVDKPQAQAAEASEIDKILSQRLN